jgi:hypothetical protein
MGNRERWRCESTPGLTSLQTAFSMVIAGEALMIPSPPRPGQDPAGRCRQGPDEASEQMAHFRSGQRKQDRRRGCINRAGGTSLRTNPSQVGCCQHDQRHVPVPSKQTTNFVMIQAHIFGVFKVFFNGTITNDKFCMSRIGRLHLSWWRLPRRARLPVPQQTVYPSETNELERCSQEDTHEKTEVHHPASRRSNDQCPEAMGSRLSSSDPMECGIFQGASTGGFSPGEQP